LNPLLLETISQELGISNVNEFLKINLKDMYDLHWKGKDVFVDIQDAADLEEIFDLILKNCPNRVLIVLPEFRERDFWWKFDIIPGELASIPDDADAFYMNDQPVGFRLWKSWLGLFELKHIRTAIGLGGRHNRTLSSGELMKITTPEDDKSD
jgi:hypothetical protein